MRIPIAWRLPMLICSSLAPDAEILREAARRFSQRDFVVTLEGRLSYASAELGSRRIAKQLIADLDSDDPAVRLFAIGSLD